MTKKPCIKEGKMEGQLFFYCPNHEAACPWLSGQAAVEGGGEGGGYSLITSYGEFILNIDRYCAYLQ